MVEFSTAGEVQRPLPTGHVPAGTLVWGPDFNSACALLYRFWGLLDAPVGFVTAQQQDGLFTDDCEISLPDTPSLDGTQLAAFADQQRAAAASAHHLDYDRVRLIWVDEQTLALEAWYEVGRQAEGSDPESSDESIRLKLTRSGDGGLRIAAIMATAEGTPRAEPFRGSFLTNRARATIIQFQAHMDSLSGRFGTMGELLAEHLELHGLVASKQDRSSGESDLTDVNTLRKSMAGSDSVADNLIRTHAEFADWFATAPALFRYGLHKLEHFAVRPIGDDRVETVAQFDWRAETLNGARIEMHQPLTWVLVEEGDKYMRIEKLLPFG